jgi:hypothetical protein
MQYESNVPEEAQWSTSELAELTDVAEWLHRLARPHVYEAVHQRALIHTVRELAPDTPLWELARAMADDALRRTLRTVGATAEPAAMRAAPLSPAGWQFACNIARTELAEDALRQLRGLGRLGRRTTNWDG